MTKIVKESLIKEGYGSGFSSTGGAIKGMGGVNRNAFGGANNLGGPNMMYTYEIKPLSHTLEQKPHFNTNLQVEEIKLGSKIMGLPIKSNITPDKKPMIGVVLKIEKTDASAIKYYVIIDQATQQQVRINPMTAKLIVNEPIEYYDDATDTITSKRREKIKAEQGRRKGIVRESINEKLSGSEAVYGFASWLTTRDTKTIMSGSDDAAPIADLVDKFIKKQDLEEPREEWTKDLIPMKESLRLIKETLNENMGYIDFFGKKNIS